MLLVDAGRGGGGLVCAIPNNGGDILTGKWGAELSAERRDFSLGATSLKSALWWMVGRGERRLSLQTE